MINRDKVKNRYINILDNIDGYSYVGIYLKGDILPDGQIAKCSYIEVKHEYCERVYIVKSSGFINSGYRCGKCCGSYENSLEFYIKNELKLNPYEIFNYDKTNPKLLHKNSNKQVWIKCKEKEYHEDSYVYCYRLIESLKSGGNGCSYCSKRNIHPKDSFAQYHIDNTDPNFLEKYWDWDKNTLDPWKIAPSNKNKVWIKCQNEEINGFNGLMKKDYHGSYEVKCDNFKNAMKNKKYGCTMCSSKNIHPFDSFGYSNFDKVQSWHPDNDISPFKITRSSGKKYKFICPECNYVFSKQIYNMSCKEEWCPNCKISKGEKKIKSWLDHNNINYIHDEPYFKDLLSNKGNPLRPDFILPDYKIWIEYDGEFHYKDMTGTLHINKIHDKRKDKYAKKHGWKLIRIPYWEFENIESILEKELFD